MAPSQVQSGLAGLDQSFLFGRVLDKVFFPFLLQRAGAILAEVSLLLCPFRSITRIITQISISQPMTTGEVFLWFFFFFC